MKLFVTGICGRLGRAIAIEATAHGHEVRGMDITPWPADNVPPPTGVEIVSSTYEDTTVLEKLLCGCDVIVHTAGPHGELVGRLNLAGFLHSNVECVASLIEAGTRVGVRRVVLSSTMEVLTGRDWAASGASVLDENSAPRCDSAYSISRLLQEQLGRELSRRHGLSIASLRYMAFGYGPDRDLGPSLLAHYLTSSDAARAVLRAAMLDGLLGDVFHIGPKTPLTNSDIIAALTGPESVLEKYFPGALAILTAKGIKLNSALFWPVTSIRKAKMILDWEPHYTFETWLMENGWKKS